MSQPPPFEEAAQCNGCKKAFGVFKRRHHCRNCGKSFCGDCQTKSLPLPHYNIAEPARVCDACNETLTNPKKAASPAASKPVAAAAPASPTAAASAQVSTPASRAAAAASADAKAPAAQPSPASTAAAAPAPVKAKRVAHCKCGLPFCICPEDAPAKDEKANPQNAPAPTKPAAKPTAAASTTASGSGSANSSSSTSLFMKPKQSGFSGFGSSSSAQWDMRGDLNEQCREAIKANDLAGVTALLKAGASATYRDRTGATLLHLAAMFDRAQMVEMLVKAGADTLAKNAQGETPIDLAPPALAAKISAKKFA